MFCTIFQRLCSVGLKYFPDCLKIVTLTGDSDIMDSVNVISDIEGWYLSKTKITIREALIIDNLYALTDKGQ